MSTAPLFPNPLVLLDELGITEPDELDIRVIAQHCKATVLFKPLDGCAARITGNADQAIITIDSKSRPERQRFSAGHELGHWMFDRGQVSLIACEEQVFVREWSKTNPETRANRYASDLLLPLPMFKPMAREFKVPDLEIKDGEIWYQGVEFDAVNTGKRYELCIQLAAMRSGKCPLMILDDVVNIDDERWRGFIAAAKGSGFQIVAARLDTGDLRIEEIDEAA